MAIDSLLWGFNEQIEFSGVELKSHGSEVMIIATEIALDFKEPDQLARRVTYKSLGYGQRMIAGAGKSISGEMIVVEIPQRSARITYLSNKQQGYFSATLVVGGTQVSRIEESANTLGVEGPAMGFYPSRYILGNHKEAFTSLKEAMRTDLYRPSEKRTDSTHT